MAAVAGDEIHLAAGTYTPTTGGDQLASFVPPAGTSILVGFDGGERTRSLRNWRTHPTIVSGEFGAPGPADNSRHVVRCNANPTLLDGFVIRDGAAIAGEGGGGVRGTTDDNYAPAPWSDLIDAGSSIDSIGESMVDLDDDAFTSFTLKDFYGLPPPINLPIAEGQSASILDVGVAEAQTASTGDPDLDGDGSVDATDLALLLGAWNTISATFDLTSDCVVDAADLAVLLGAWD